MSAFESGGCFDSRFNFVFNCKYISSELSPLIICQTGVMLFVCIGESIVLRTCTQRKEEEVLYGTFPTYPLC